MGCDIHMFVEYVRWEEQDGKKNWDTFVSNGGTRDYTMFELLAGVRGDKNRALYEPRGYPDDMSTWGTKEALWLHVSDKYEDQDGYCSQEEADQWVSSRWSERIDENWVTNPDMHSASWLTTDEYRRVLAAYVMEHGSKPHVSYSAMLAAMDQFEERGHKARVVFAFDN